MGGGGGFKSKEPTAANQASVTKLLENIQSDKSISDVTKQDLAKRLGSQGGIAIGKFREIGAELEKAREGLDPKFKSRQIRQRKIDLSKDQPGRRQTLLGR